MRQSLITIIGAVTIATLSMAALAQSGRSGDRPGK
jgi:hypothetical protein